MGHKIYVIRHGPVQMNRQGEWSLSATGVALTIELARNESWEHMGFLYYSPERAARQTARIIARVIGVPLRSNEELRDINGWGLATSQIIGRPEGEDRKAAIDRISTCLKELMRANPGRSIGVVAHGRILALFYSHMLGRSVSLLEWLSVPVPAVCVIDGDSWKIERAFQYKELSDNNQDW
ncbi:MAG: histidine phosphatase family protein [Sulfobacillus thermotolerans]|uniref:Cyclic nucleotide-binding domain-containing protein n=1 Tax=Sulfobacillus thermotolerans TaxID=338644 RepID=A0ABN5H0I6_9FIRM|nr:hypothetical protein BXT84_05050 [Sulfobacillus thermotolerans]MCY0906967.1 histidine phosphatase family protein [Sulfobacillus thermotolerans]